MLQVATNDTAAVFAVPMDDVLYWSQVKGLVHLGVTHSVLLEVTRE